MLSNFNDYYKEKNLPAGFMNNKNIILVTGCAGFIGSHTTEYLLKRGDYVIGIDNLNNFYDINLKKKFRYIK